MSVSKKVKSSVMIHEKIWQDIRILAIRQNMEIGELVEESFKKTLEESVDNKESKLAANIKLLADRYETDESVIIKNIKELGDKFSISNEDVVSFLKVQRIMLERQELISPPELEKANSEGLTENELSLLQRKFSKIYKFIQKIAEESKCSNLEATQLIKTRKDLIKKLTNELNIVGGPKNDESQVIKIINNLSDFKNITFENEQELKDNLQENKIENKVKN